MLFSQARPAPIFVPIFLGGPKEGQIIATERLPNVLYFVDYEGRTIVAYEKREELTYVYLDGLSDRLSQNFDHNSKKIG
jgi:hypothetical protein